MAKAEPLDGGANPRAFFGAELQRVRTEAELGRDDLAKRMYVTESYIGKLERSVKLPNEDFAERLDVVLDTNGHFVRLLELATRSSEYPPFFSGVAGLQQEARRLEEFSPYLFPGLLQCESYAYEVTKAVWPYASSEFLQEKVAKRRKRAELLEGNNAPEMWVIVAEQVVREQGVLPRVMAEQLEHVVALVEQRRVVVQVLPQSTGMHALRSGQLTLLTLRDGEQLAYVEGPHSGQLIDAPGTVELCRQAYDQVRAEALPRDQSLSLLMSAMEDCKRGQQEV